YPPRSLTWTDTTFTEFRREVVAVPADPAGLSQRLGQLLAPGHFRNLNQAQATGAQRMMMARCEETRQVFAALARHSDPAAGRQLVAALDSPYPFAHYLAACGLAERGEPDAIPLLLKKLDAFAKTPDTVGFWWCCEALARLKAKEAVPALARHATDT